MYMYKCTCTILHFLSSSSSNSIHGLSLPTLLVDAPSPPNIIETTFTATCTLKISWEIESSENHVASTDQVKVEQRLCLYDAQTCDKEWEEVDVYPPSISTCVVPLLPNQDYSFRLTSNNSLVGYGEPFDITIPFSSNVVGK